MVVLTGADRQCVEESIAAEWGNSRALQKKRARTHTRTAPRARLVSCKCSGKFRLPNCVNLSGPIFYVRRCPVRKPLGNVFVEKQNFFFLFWKKKKERHHTLFMAPFAIKWQNLCNSAAHGEANGGPPSKELSSIFFFFFSWIMHAAVQEGQRLIHKDRDLRLQWTTRPFLSWKINQPDI